MIDTAALSVDLLGLVGADVTLKKVASTRGGEFAGPCPFCGGRDRFKVWPNAGRPGYWCRQCDAKGDGIAYVMQRERVGFLEACRILGASPSAAARPSPATPALPADIPVDDDPPPIAWQARARAFVTYAENVLWSDAGVPALRYLRERRGLTDETIRRWRLGLNPADGFDAPGRWGITNMDGKKIWIPRGLVIPCETFGELWRVKVRRPLPPTDDAIDELAHYLEPVTFRPADKYVQIKGSRPALFGGDSLIGQDVALVAEGEFDAMLAAQAIGAEVAVVTPGSAGALPAGRWLMAFLAVRRILIAYDLDAAGREGAEKWAALSARVRVCRPPAHDLTAAWQEGHIVRKWILFHVAKHAPAATIAEPAAIAVGDLVDARDPALARLADEWPAVVAEVYPPAGGGGDWVGLKTKGGEWIACVAIEHVRRASAEVPMTRELVGVG